MMVIDNQMNPGKYSKEELRQNATEANAAYVDDYAVAAAAVDYAAADAANAAVYYDAYYAVDYWIDIYFKLSGEDRQDYIDEINKEK